MDYNNISKEKFRFADPNRRTGDKKLDTKQMSYAKDVFRRFCKNKSSVVAAIIILLLVLFAIFVPLFCETEYSKNLTDTKNMSYIKLLPKCTLFEGTGFWDGTKETTVNENRYISLIALQTEIGEPVITKFVKGPYDTSKIVAGKEEITTYYDVRLDTYLTNGIVRMTFTKAEFEAIQAFQKETGRQIIVPWVNANLSYSNLEEELSWSYEELAQKIGFTYGRMDNKTIEKLLASSLVHKDHQTNANLWYATDSKGNALLNSEGNFIPAYATKNQKGFKGIGYTEQFYNYNSLRIQGDPGIDDPTSKDAYLYAKVSPTWAGGDMSGEPTSVAYECRVVLNNYFEFRYGHRAAFLFGTDDKGQDILTRLASGARFSLILAICISAVNLFIGAMYGAVEGFYGGAVDLVMERISDILGGMPTMVVMSLFQLHLAKHVGPVWSMVFAFILTGWLGMAARTRMQFYRFKRQEYVLAARTLGASDGRLMFKHIFPNAMGTLITGSILMIPGVIFSESSLTYLGIVNLEGGSTTSVGTLLSNASGALPEHPHLIFWPALFVSLLEISFNLFGNGLRDAFNPSLKGNED